MARIRLSIDFVWASCGAKSIYLAGPIKRLMDSPLTELI